MFKKVFLFCGIMLTALCCMSPEKTLKNTSAERLYFGNFGGFTNIPNAYVLIDESRIFKIEKDTYTSVRKLRKAELKEIRELINNVHLDTLQLNEPGNMTYYLRLTKAGSQNEIKWTDNSQNMPVKKIYTTLMSLVNQ